MGEGVLEQPLIQPELPTEHREEADLIERRPGILRKFWRAYIRALNERPILVKSATSFFGFLIGDLLAQGLSGRGFDVFRCLRLLAFGVTMDGPVGHLWYTFLDQNIMPKEPTSNKAVVLKMLVDQLLWAPFFSCIFFAFTNTLAGHPEATIPAIQNKLIPMMLANFAVWPIAHLINFKFIPSQQRILYINCIQIAWSAYLSNLSAARVRASN
ncbi:g4555 [Coccomyxa elongata]